MNDIEWDYPNPYTVEVTVAEEDIDGLNHANNAVYVKWCEMAGWAHSCDLGLDIEAYRELDRAMAIQKAEYEYLQATLLNEELLVATWITESDGKLSMIRRFQIVRISDGATVLRGQWKVVCIEMSSGRPRRMPPEFRDGYGAVLVDVAP
ncbi:acyl-CoA thioesterase [Pseudoteredinibacter isoporae]|uniref:Acyl-CoA thioester hydrolase n=1 Tax=Pseudoteredinibacter isoporae TaxID=570281 RepID=A0A7X0JRU6_9GAMM|nr:thioesterase family protein [Pseudoteredinibacter isoporae]MBB6520634.1 acyl-CoA thioester hydrolase [Pseudoteredinibacter isoporae]NHO86201.1 acyl-CoA thioesterase [Pseudoteredinibacter isoporae]NIB25348.1 acyl-CoA thioesterase [Pseudoteredinibacter isoporae]